MIKQAPPALHDLFARLKLRLPQASLPLICDEGLAVQTHGLPDWWSENGNVLVTREEITNPDLLAWGNSAPPSRALVILAGIVVPDRLILWGTEPVIALGTATKFPAARIACGDGAIILVGDRTSSTWAAQVDCRNGGMILVGEDGLWGSDVQVNSDDMHAIRDLSGKRLNAFGGKVIIARRVWLGRDSMILGGAQIEQDTVVGARSIVKAHIPANVVCAGAPAQVIRSGTRWDFEDQP